MNELGQGRLISRFAPADFFIQARYSGIMVNPNLPQNRRLPASREEGERFPACSVNPVLRRSRGMNR